MVRAIVRRFAQYVQRNPLRLFEHVLIATLLIAYVSTNKHKCLGGQKHCCCPSEEPGPISVFNLEGVVKAPKPAMDVDKLTRGQVVEYHDNRGDIYRFKMDDKVVVNMYKTVAGNMRSGDLHNCTQYDIILKGKATLYTKDVLSGRETAMPCQENQLIAIPPRVPHLFDFHEDNYLLEWWDCDFEAWYYQPYRERIDRSISSG